MKTLEEIKAILAGHKRELVERFHVRRIGVFGSYARSEQAAGSDLDILVEFHQPVGWEVVDLHEYLEQVLEAKVDLVTKGAVARQPLLWQSIQEDLVDV